VGPTALPRIPLPEKREENERKGRKKKRGKKEIDRGKPL